MNGGRFRTDRCERGLEWGSFQDDRVDGVDRGLQGGLLTEYKQPNKRENYKHPKQIADPPGPAGDADPPGVPSHAVHGRRRRRAMERARRRAGTKIVMELMSPSPMNDDQKSLFCGSRIISSQFYCDKYKREN